MMFSLYNQGWRSAYSCITLKNQFYGGLYYRLKKPKGSRILPDSFLWQRFCEDNRPCKHIIAVEHYLVGYVTIEGEEPKTEPITYSQDWSTYNMAQAHEIELFDYLLQE